MRHYKTQPGTLQHRVMAYLRAHAPGAEFSTVQLCDALDADPTGFATAMLHARRAGMLKYRPAPQQGRVLMWSLGDGTPEKSPAADYDAQVDNGKNTLPVKQEFRCAMWQGGIIMTGVRMVEPGAVYLPQEQARKLRASMAWETP